MKLDRSATVIFRCPAPVRSWLERTAEKNDSTLTMQIINLVRAEMDREKAERESERA